MNLFQVGQVGVLTVAGLAIAGCVTRESGRTAERDIDWAKSYIVLSPEVTRAIGGVSELDRKAYFAVNDNGTGFDKRMPPEIYDYLVHDLGIEI